MTELLIDCLTFNPEDYFYFEKLFVGVLFLEKGEFYLIPT